MGCTTSLTISESSGNTGLDQAVYDSGTGKIFGVRGQWLFRFNATTGVKEAALQWCDDMSDFASLTVLNGKIYLGASFLPYIDLNWFGTEAAVPMDVYKVDAASFTRDGRTFFNAYRTPYDNVGNWNNPLFGVGYHLIITDGTYIYTAAGAFDPSNVANVGGNYHSLFPMGVEYDSFNGVIWFVDPYSTGGIGAAQSGLPATNHARTSGSIADPICGITYNAATNYAYVATGTESILKVSHVNTSTWANLTYSVLHTGRVACNAVRIKSCNNLVGNPYNGKVLIPSWAEDLVLVWNPNTDNVADMVIKSGFTAPFDIVHCPTASFAVQSGSTGLKIIT